MANMIEILNTIRDNASTTYQDRVPEANITNMEEIRYAMLGGEDNIVVANEFTSVLLNKIVKSIFITKMFENPLKSLKKGKKPLGDTIEEIYNNFLKAGVYDSIGATLLERNLPDTKTVYHRMNSKLKYKITVSREALSKAFVSYDALEKYINDIIKQLYNSAELDEFINMKQLIKSALDKNAVKVITVADPLTSEANGKEFIKAVKTTSGLMKYPNDSFNGYLTAQSVDTKAITTFSRPEEQILIIDTATNVSVSVDVLASLFNMTVAEFNETRKIVIDSFPDENIRAFLCDEEFFQVYDDLFEVRPFDNGEGLYTNYILHVWQTMAFSILVNAVAFKVEPVTT